MTGSTVAIIWLIIAVILFVIEGATVQLLCIWFAFGSLVAMLAAMVGAPLFLQLACFIVTSLAVLVFGRPFLKKRLTPKRTATNADAIIGQYGIVIQEIDNTLQDGRVMAGGLDWSARSAGEYIIPVDSKVRVLKIDGVKLIVEAAGHDEGEGN